MAGTLNKLHWKTIKAETKPGKYGDGGGLWAYITPTQRSWVFLYSFGGKRCSMGLGSLAATTLAAAREKAEIARDLVARGMDPKEARDAGKPKSGVPSFGECADTYIDAHQSEWKGGADGAQRREWARTLSRLRDDAGKLLKEGYCLPIIDKPVDGLTVEDVLACIKAHWTTRQVTMVRLRARIEAVIDAAVAAGHRTAPNPAPWKTLRPLLAKIDYSVEHHAAIDWRRLPALMAALRATPGIAARCLEFIILTAARSQEARLATWAEVDLEGRCWTVPAAHMKRGREHQVPLCDRAVAVLRELEAIRPENGDGLIFPSEAGTPLSVATVADALHAIAEGVTVHGMRSAFSDWSNDCTDYHADVIEHALSHAVKGVRGSYRRATAYGKRVSLMAAWDAYCTGTPAKAIQAPATAAETARAGLSVALSFPGLAPANGNAKAA